MARRGSVRSIYFALLAAAGAGAAQLGLGYGLDIIAWEPTRADATAPGATTIAAGSWTAALTWTTWLAATSVVVGAVVGDRVRDHNGGRFARAAGRLMLALAATLGAGAVIIPLVAVPASQAHVGGNYAPHLLVAIYATAGALIGLVMALVAMAARAVAANVFATAAWLWALAVIAVGGDTVGEHPYGYAQLGVWKFTATGPVWHGYYLPGALVLLGSALLIGGTAAFAAAGRGDGRFGVVISGAAGPVLVLATYLLARPTDAPVEQLSAYHSAPYMVAAGLIGSILVAAVGGGFTRRSSRSAADANAPASQPA